MRKIALTLTILLGLKVFAFSQSGKIKYIFSDPVEEKLDKYIREYSKHEPKASFYLECSHVLDSTIYAGITGSTQWRFTGTNRKAR